MKKALAIVLMALTANASAIVWRDDPTELHDLSRLKERTFVVTVKYANDPKAVCDRESRKMGNKGFAYQVQACAFWTDELCTMVFPKKASQHTIGHEFLHCLKGDYHPQ